MRRILIIALLVFVGAGGFLAYKYFFSPQLPAHCRDDLYNHGEEGLDCGGSCPNRCRFTEKCGRLEQDETWSGNIYVKCYFEVPGGLTLTVNPGTEGEGGGGVQYKGGLKVVAPGTEGEGNGGGKKIEIEE